MQPNATNTLLFYGKSVITALLLIVNPNSALTKVQCIPEKNTANSCAVEHSLKLESQSVSQNNNTSENDRLYYSGGVLHNRTSVIQSIPEARPQSSIDVGEEAELQKNITEAQRQVGTLAKEYSELRKIFQNMDDVGKKSVQQCLKFGNYNAKVDGIWGDKTFDAIKNFKNVSSHTEYEKEHTLFVKIKNMFSKKTMCYKLLNSIFSEYKL